MTSHLRRTAACLAWADSRRARLELACPWLLPVEQLALLRTVCASGLELEAAVAAGIPVVFGLALDLMEPDSPMLPAPDLRRLFEFRQDERLT